MSYFYNFSLQDIVKRDTSEMELSCLSDIKDQTSPIAKQHLDTACFPCDFEYEASRREAVRPVHCLKHLLSSVRLDWVRDFP